MRKRWWKRKLRMKKRTQEDEKYDRGK